MSLQAACFTCQHPDCLDDCPVHQENPKAIYERRLREERPIQYEVRRILSDSEKRIRAAYEAVIAA
jgi:NADPH-dependent glutamate synthase beta subunit-like oxidoreductase